MINQFTITETDGDASYCQYIVLWLKTNSLSQEEVCPVFLCFLIGRKEWIKICHIVLQLVLLVDMPRLCQIKCYLIILLVIWITWTFHVFNIHNLMLMCTVTCSRFWEKLIFFHRMIQQESWSGREFFHLWCCFKSEKYIFFSKIVNSPRFWNFIFSSRLLNWRLVL